MAEQEGTSGPGGTRFVGHPVIEAGKVAVGLLRAAWDDDTNFSRAGSAAMLRELDNQALTHLAAVQTVWLLEQMEWIAHAETPHGATMSVDDQIASRGREIALSDPCP